MPNFKFKSKFAKNITKDILAPHLDIYFSKEVTDFTFALEPKKKDDAWHPSGDCTPSVTELYAMALERQAGRSGSRVSKAFPVGHFWHQLLQKAVVDLGFATPEAIERRGMKVWAEDNSWGPTPSAKLATPKPFHWSTGMGDVAPLTVPNQPPMVLDFKTMSNAQFGKPETPMPGWIAQKYEAQINIYMDYFDYNHAMILAVQKDTPHGFKEFIYERNQDLIDAVYDKWYFVSECLDNEAGPDEEDDKEYSLEGLFMGPVESL